MSLLKPLLRRASVSTIATGVLSCMCFGGAISYAAVIGTSLAAMPSETPATSDLDAMGNASQLPPAPIGFLHATVTDGEETYERTLNCSGNPFAQDPVCAELAREDDLFEEVPPGSVCTDLLYGPEQATVWGKWNGQKVEIEVTRDGSCEDARWQRLQPLLERP